MLVEGQTRKSVRIAAIEAAKRENKRKRNASARTPSEAGGGGPSDGKHGSGIPRRRRNRKRKRLDEVAETSLSPPTPQDGGEEQYENHPVENGYLLSMHTMPEKHFLENALNILQRADKHKIFAQPVDQEVDGYYQVIEEPMDFSTLRANVQEEKYKTLEEFEYDVLLVSKNALFFNGETTVYHKQAQAMYELSKRVLKILKTDPENIVQLEHDISPIKRQVERKRRSKVGSSRTPRRFQRRIRDSPWSSSNKLINQRDNKVQSGCSPHHGTKKFAQSRDSYKPFAPNSIYPEGFNGSKLLVPGDGGIGYKESLMRFVRKLGPTAQRVAAQKLMNIGQKHPPQLQTAPAFMKTSSLTSSLPRESPFAVGVGSRQSPIIPCNSARNFLTDTNANDPLNTQRGSLGRCRDEKGKNVVIYDDTRGRDMDFFTKNCYSDYLEKFASERRGIRIVDDSLEKVAPRGKPGIHSAVEGERYHVSEGMAVINPLGITDSPALSGEIIQPADRDFFRAFLNDVSNLDHDNLKNPAAIQGFDSPTSRTTSFLDVFPENQRSVSQIGSFANDKTPDLNNPTAGIGAVHGKIAGSSQLHNQVPQNQMAGGPASSLLAATPRNNRITKTCVYPSTYLRPSKFSRISNMVHASGTSRNPGFSTSSPHVNPLLVPSQPKMCTPLAIDELSEVQPLQQVGNQYGVQHDYLTLGTYQRLLSLGEVPSVQEAHSVATPDMQPLPMIQWGNNAAAEEEVQRALASYLEVPDTESNLLCQNSSASPESIVLGLGQGLRDGIHGASAQNPYLKPCNVNSQLSQAAGIQRQKSQVAGPSNVYGQWRSTLPLNHEVKLEQERQLMPPPQERMSVPRSVDGRNFQESQEARTSFQGVWRPVQDSSMVSQQHPNLALQLGSKRPPPPPGF